MGISTGAAPSESRTSSNSVGALMRRPCRSSRRVTRRVRVRIPGSAPPCTARMCRPSSSRRNSGKRAPFRVDRRDQADIGHAVSQLGERLVGGQQRAGPDGANFHGSPGLSLHPVHPGPIGPTERVVRSVLARVQEDDRIRCALSCARDRRSARRGTTRHRYRTDSGERNLPRSSPDAPGSHPRPDATRN